jgi:hypothetical protein
MSDTRFLAKVVRRTVSALAGNPSHVGDWVFGSVAIHSRKDSRREPSGATSAAVPPAVSAGTSTNSVSKLRS